MFSYLDPASGSMILSAIAGGAAGIAVFVKSFGHRIRSKFSIRKRDVPVDGDETAAAGDGGPVHEDESGLDDGLPAAGGQSAS